MRTLLQKSITCTALVLAALAASAQAAQEAAHHHDHGSPASAAMAPLVEKVRAVTAKYADVKVATGEGWVQATPCVSGPNSGAMGVHFVLPSRIGDGTINAAEPESLIYEPQRNGALRLVGVEFIVIAADWAKLHKEGGTPSVDGHLMHYVGEPNRYGLPAFYEMHVWAWEQNPSGNFADFNSRVSCDNQGGPAS